MRKIRGVLLALAVTAMLGVAVPASASTASAPASPATAASKPDCANSGAMCLWARPNYQPNGWILFFPPTASGQCRDVGIIYPNVLGSRSFWNRTSKVQRVWESDHCTGQNFLVSAGTSYASSPFTVNSVGGL